LSRTNSSGVMPFGGAIWKRLEPVLHALVVAGLVGLVLPSVSTNVPTIDAS